jgi:catechol 2,3-dioxygenase-like lactoylglutathione lyase family enzyme
VPGPGVETRIFHVLNGAHARTMLPVEDLERARAFYREKLGVEPAQDNPGGLLYRLADGAEFLLYPSGYRPGGHTQVNLTVDDFDATVAALRSRGVVFQDYDLPGLKTIDGVALAGPHKSAWFKDSEGNLFEVMGRTR